MLPEYIARFRKLRSDNVTGRWSALTNHRAPHKPLLLLAIMDLVAEGALAHNRIEPTAELVELFTLYWSKVTRPEQRSSMAYPFFHLSRDGFWHLEAVLAATKHIRSVSQLLEIVRCACFDDALYALVCVETTRNLLRAALIETYFAPELQPVLIDQASINVEAYRYSQELLEQARHQRIRDGLEDDQRYRSVVRDQAFRRAVVLAYSHRCAICGLRIITADRHIAVDAAHIVPWSVSHDDDPRNGMALCRLCHWTFDEGLVGVSAKYAVLTSQQLSSNPNFPGHLLTLTGRPIVGPDDQALWPDLKALAYHRTRVFRTR